MLLFPSLRDRITSPHSPDEVCGLLQGMTESRYISFSTNCEFIGKADTSGFSIRPYIQGRNSFLPVIKGRVLPAGGGSEIVVRMGLYLSVKLLMSVWFGGGGFFFLCGLAAGIVDGFENAWQLTAISAGMFATGQILMRASFLHSARKAQKRLRELFV